MVPGGPASHMDHPGVTGQAVFGAPSEPEH